MPPTAAHTTDPGHLPTCRIGRWRLLVLATAALVALAGCTGQDEVLPAAQPPVEPGLGHVHDLSVNPADGRLYAATHFGLWVADDGRLSRVGDAHHDLHDLMGFAVLGADRFAASGHPLLDEDDLPPHLGYIVSDDGGHTWRSVSLLGEADFHTLELSGEGLYGYDATGGRLLHTTDGEDWEIRADDVRLPALAVDPDDASHLLAARTADAGGSWTAQARLPALPGALTDHDGRLYADADEGIIVFSDDGASWAPYAIPDAQP